MTPNRLWEGQNKTVQQNLPQNSAQCTILITVIALLHLNIISIKKLVKVEKYKELETD